MHEVHRENGCPRIAYSLKRFPRLSETFIANEILALEQKGFDVAIFSMKRPEGLIHEFVKEIKSPVFYLPGPSKKNLMKFVIPHLYVFLMRPVGYVRCLLYARSHRSRESRRKFLLAGYVSRSVISGKVQHLHSHFASGSTRLAKYVHLITGVPFSFTAHAKDIFSDRVSRKQLRRRMEKAKFVVTISDYNRKYLKGILKSAKIFVIRNGIPLESFSPNGKHAMREKVPIVLAVGRLVEKKGFSYLIDACAELKRLRANCRCVIVGDGPLRGQIEAQIRRLDLQGYVTLEGFKTHDELIREYYRKATLFALPCKETKNKDRDGLPVALEEAMAMGIPVVTTPIEGSPERLRHNRTGALVPAGDLGRCVHRSQAEQAAVAQHGRRRAAVGAGAGLGFGHRPSAEHSLPAGPPGVRRSVPYTGTSGGVDGINCGATTSGSWASASVVATSLLKAQK